MKKLETFSVRFIPIASKSAKHPVEKLYARITVAGERTEVSLGQDIAPGLFDKFKLTYKTVQRDILTIEEIEKLVKLKIPEERLDQVSDFFFAFTPDWHLLM